MLLLSFLKIEKKIYAQNNMNIIDVNKYRSIKDGIYGDVISHCKNPVTNEGRYTNVHETSHFISSELRFGRKRQNGFYILDGKAVILDQPNITINDIIEYVPPNIRGYRYRLYFINQQKYWNEQPLYILEEWNCYILGGMCAIEDFNNNKKLERTDAVAGMFEFMIYSIATAMCIKDKDKNYWTKNNDFKQFLSSKIIDTKHLFDTGRKIPAFKSKKSDILYKNYATSPEGKIFEKFISQNLFTKKSWGFDKYL